MHCALAYIGVQAAANMFGHMCVGTQTDRTRQGMLQFHDVLKEVFQ